jgi:hypothetical protein
MINKNGRFAQPGNAARAASQAALTCAGEAAWPCHRVSPPARAAFPGWAKRPFAERQATVEKFAAQLEAHKAELCGPPAARQIFLPSPDARQTAALPSRETRRAPLHTAQVSAACEAARAAFPGWAKRPFAERQATVEKFAASSCAANFSTVA